MYDHNTQRPRGFGFITYDSEEAVDKVLLKTFHELNGKMVEVKRAVPKELSPGPSRNQLGTHNYGLSRVSSFLTGYTQSYNPSSVGGYGLRIDGRYGPVTIGRSGFTTIGPGYGMGLNFEPNLSPSHGGGANLSPNLSYGRGLNPSFGGNSNRYSSPGSYGAGNGGNSSVLSSPSRNLWGNGNLNYALNTANSNAFLGSGGGTSGMGSLGSLGALWDSSPDPGHGGGAGAGYSSGNLSYGNGDLVVGSGAVGYGRNSMTSVPPVSSTKGSYDVAYGDIYESGSFYGDSTWRPSSSELEGSGSFGFGVGPTASDVMTKNSAGYVGGYSVTDRQANRGKIFFSIILYSFF